MCWCNSKSAGRIENRFINNFLQHIQLPLKTQIVYLFTDETNEKYGII